MDYPGWTIETTHPIDEADPEYCAACHEAVAPTVAFAIDWGSVGHGHQFTDAEGITHHITVRQV